ncbi:MAG: methyltransferase domain-containing protein [Ruegeria sp.]
MVFQRGYPSDDLSSELYGKWIDGSKIYTWKFHPMPIRHFDYTISQVRKVVSSIEKIPREIKFLDFGMGWGDFSLAAKAFGAQVTGVELSRDKQEHGRQLGINVVEAPTDIYDVIFLNQVLEHLPDPVAILSKLKEHLADNGLIYAAVPNGTPVYNCAAGFGEAQFIKNQKIVAPLEHLNVFNFDTLRQAGKSAGLSAEIPPVDALSRATLASIKGRLFKKLGLAKATAAEVFYRHDKS